MKILFAAGAVALALAPAASAGTPSNVSVRVEGLTSTVLPRTAVTTTTAPVSKDGDPAHSCPGTTAVGALELATAGDWSGYWDDAFGQSVERILGEEHPFDPDAERNYYWTFWNNFEYQNAGACATELQEGDEVLFSLGCFGACETPTPMRLSVPGRAAPGQPVEARVTEYALVCDESFNCATEPREAAGATVTAGAVTATTDAAGVARLTLSERGPQGVRATKDGFIPTATEPVCVTDGADGACGTSAPGADPGTPCLTDGADGRCGTRDGRPPAGRILGIADGERFTRRRAPREFHGTVEPDPSGLHSVKLRLKRRRGGDCWGLSKRQDRLIRIRCSRPFFITIGDRAEWSYLLPERLRRGRYTIKAVAIDKVGNAAATVTRIRVR